MIYVASPYSHPDASVREDRFDLTCRFVGQLMQGGELVYSPIVHNHPIAIRMDTPMDFDYWRKHDFAMLGLCDSVRVFKLPGWEDSKGISAELTEAVRLGLGIGYAGA